MFLRVVDVGYGQSSIHNEFQDGRTFHELFSEILREPHYIARVPPIPVMFIHDRYYAMNGNRRLFVYKQLAKCGVLMEIWVQLGSYSPRKFTNCNGGHDVFVRRVQDQQKFRFEFTQLWEKVMESQKALDYYFHKTSYIVDLSHKVRILLQDHDFEEIWNTLKIMKERIECYKEVIDAFGTESLEHWRHYEEFIGLYRDCKEMVETEKSNHYRHICHRGFSLHDSQFFHGNLEDTSCMNRSEVGSRWNRYLTRLSPQRATGYGFEPMSSEGFWTSHGSEGYWH